MIMKKNMIWAAAIGSFMLVQACDMAEDRQVTDEQVEETEGALEDDEMLDEDDGFFSEWDANDDDYVDEEELYGRMNTDPEIIPDDWDTENDGVIDEDDWGSMVYTTGDLNEDLEWTEDEWNEFTANWEDVNWGNWNDWDADGDEILSEEEWETGIADQGWFDDWDLDGDDELNTEELGGYAYDYYDTDNDGLLTEEEFDAYAEDWGIEQT
jgi:hypothetical protein